MPPTDPKSSPKEKAAGRKQSRKRAKQFKKEKAAERIQISKKPREVLELELEKCRSLLKVMGATFYAMKLTAIELGNKLPLKVPIPIEWLGEAHKLVEGKTLEDVQFRINEDDPDNCYIALFEDSRGNNYVLTHSYNEASTTLRSGEDEYVPLPSEPETHLWYQAAVLAIMRKLAHKQGGQVSIGYTIWDWVLALAQLYENKILKDQKILPEDLSPDLFEKAYRMTRAIPELMAKDPAPPEDPSRKDKPYLQL